MTFLADSHFLFQDAGVLLKHYDLGALVSKGATKVQLRPLFPLLISQNITSKMTQAGDLFLLGEEFLHEQYYALLTKDSYQNKEVSQ